MNSIKNFLSSTLKVTDYENMKKICINSNLEEKKRTDYEYHFRNKTFNEREYWTNQTKNLSSTTKKEYNIQYTLSNHEKKKEFINYSNPFLQAFMNAYNNHEDILLSPDDIWFMICLNFTKYVNENAQKVRHLFVDHTSKEGKKKLTVNEPAGKEEKDWDDFFKEMKLQISQYVKDPKLISILSNNFSTTTKVESILSSACIMDTFKSYFEYDRCIPDCGIRNLFMKGKLEDWEQVKEKTRSLLKFMAKGQLQKETEFTSYLTNLFPILNEFILTYQGQGRAEFWNKIMNFKDGTQGSGSTTYITGWILCFYLGFTQDSKNVEIEDLNLNHFQVPIQVTNHSTGQNKTCYIMGGFVGVSVNRKEKVHSPVMSLGIAEDVASIQSIF